MKVSTDLKAGGLLVNAAGTAPSVSLQSRTFFTYSDVVQYQVIDDRDAVRLEGVLPVHERLTKAVPGAAAPLYLIAANPGMNGVAFDADQPWGVVAGNQGLGSNGPVPPLFLYVPPECEQFKLTCDSTSPNEGARVTVRRPDGAEAAVMDGEFDQPETRTVAVPPEGRGKVWTFTWGRPQSVKAALDDVVVTLDGALAPVLWPRADWAEKHGPRQADGQGK